jgi:very-short-patch-repair endonuclease
MPKNLPKNPEIGPFARQLRKNATKEENKLWFQFLRSYPSAFRRQYVIGPYITDFYCKRAALALELDGSQHYEPEEQLADERRTAWLRQQGIMVLRFTNLDILQRFHAVCEEIDRVVKERMEEKN